MINFCNKKPAAFRFTAGGRPRRARAMMILCGLFLHGFCLAETPVIAVASNLTSPVTEIANAFNTQTNDSVLLSFGSSGSLARQIIQGAPHEVFISAGKEYVEFLLSRKTPVRDHYEFVYGGIVLFIPGGSVLRDYTSRDSITNALIYKSYRKIAIANPEFAPYGVAAMQALQSAGLWAIERSSIVMAESAAKVVPYALSGNIDVAVIPYSFILQNDLDQRGKYYALPETWHNRITQYIVIMGRAGQVSLDFVNYLHSEPSLAILKRYGYQIIETDRDVEGR